MLWLLILSCICIVEAGPVIPPGTFKSIEFENGGYTTILTYEVDNLNNVMHTYTDIDAKEIYLISTLSGESEANGVICKPAISVEIIVGPNGCDHADPEQADENSHCPINAANARNNRALQQKLFYFSPTSDECVVGIDQSGGGDETLCLGPIMIIQDNRNHYLAHYVPTNRDLLRSRGLRLKSYWGQHAEVHATTTFEMEMPYLEVTSNCFDQHGDTFGNSIPPAEYEIFRTDSTSDLITNVWIVFRRRFTKQHHRLLLLRENPTADTFRICFSSQEGTGGDSDYFVHQYCTTTLFNEFATDFDVNWVDLILDFAAESGPGNTIPMDEYGGNYQSNECFMGLEMIDAPSPPTLVECPVPNDLEYAQNVDPPDICRTEICGYGIGSYNSLLFLNRPFCGDQQPCGGKVSFTTNDFPRIPIQVDRDPRYDDYVLHCEYAYPLKSTFQGYGSDGTNGGFYNRKGPQGHVCRAPFLIPDFVAEIATDAEREQQCHRMGMKVGLRTLDHCFRPMTFTKCKKGYHYFDQYCYYKPDPHRDLPMKTPLSDTADLICSLVDLELGTRVRALKRAEPYLRVWIAEYLVMIDRKGPGEVKLRVPVEGRRCECYDYQSPDPLDPGEDISDVRNCNCDEDNYPVCRYRAIVDYEPFGHFVSIPPDTVRIYQQGQKGIPFRGEETPCDCLPGWCGENCDIRCCGIPVEVTSNLEELVNNPTTTFYIACINDHHGSCKSGQPHMCSCEPNYGPPAVGLSFDTSEEGIPQNTTSYGSILQNFVKFPCALPSTPVSYVPNPIFRVNDIRYNVSFLNYIPCSGIDQGSGTVNEFTNEGRCDCTTRADMNPDALRVLEAAYDGESCACRIPLVPPDGFQINGPMVESFCNAHGTCGPFGERHSDKRIEGESIGYSKRLELFENGKGKAGCQDLCDNGWGGIACTCPVPFDHGLEQQTVAGQFRAYVDLQERTVLSRIFTTPKPQNIFTTQTGCTVTSVGYTDSILSTPTACVLTEDGEGFEITTFWDCKHTTTTTTNQNICAYQFVSPFWNGVWTTSTNAFDYGVDGYPGTVMGCDFTADHLVGTMAFKLETACPSSASFNTEAKLDILADAVCETYTACGGWTWTENIFFDSPDAFHYILLIPKNFENLDIFDDGTVRGKTTFDVSNGLLKDYFVSYKLETFPEFEYSAFGYPIVEGCDFNIEIQHDLSYDGGSSTIHYLDLDSACDTSLLISESQRISVAQSACESLGACGSWVLYGPENVNNTITGEYIGVYGLVLMYNGDGVRFDSTHEKAEGVIFGATCTQTLNFVEDPQNDDVNTFGQFVVVTTDEEFPSCDIEIYSEDYVYCGDKTKTSGYAGRFFANEVYRSSLTCEEEQFTQFVPWGCTTTACMCSPNYMGDLCEAGVSGLRIDSQGRLNKEPCGSSTTPSRGKYNSEKGCECEPITTEDSTLGAGVVKGIFEGDACECASLYVKERNLRYSCAGHGKCRKPNIGEGVCEYDHEDFLNDPLSNPNNIEIGNLRESFVYIVRNRNTLDDDKRSVLSIHNESWAFPDGHEIELPFVYEDVHSCLSTVMTPVTLGYYGTDETLFPLPQRVQAKLTVWTLVDICAGGAYMGTPGCMLTQISYETCDPSAFPQECSTTTHCHEEFIGLGEIPPDLYYDQMHVGFESMYTCIAAQEWIVYPPDSPEQNQTLEFNPVYSNVWLQCIDAERRDAPLNTLGSTRFGVMNCNDAVHRTLDHALKLRHPDTYGGVCGDHPITDYSNVLGEFYGLFYNQIPGLPFVNPDAWTLEHYQLIAQLLNNKRCFNVNDDTPADVWSCFNKDAYIESWLDLVEDGGTPLFSYDGADFIDLFPPGAINGTTISMVFMDIIDSRHERFNYLGDFGSYWASGFELYGLSDILYLFDYVNDGRLEYVRRDDTNEFTNAQRPGILSIIPGPGAKYVQFLNITIPPNMYLDTLEVWSVEGSLCGRIVRKMIPGDILTFDCGAAFEGLSNTVVRDQLQFFIDDLIDFINGDGLQEIFDTLVEFGSELGDVFSTLLDDFLGFLEDSLLPILDDILADPDPGAAVEFAEYLSLSGDCLLDLTGTPEFTSVEDAIDDMFDNVVIIDDIITGGDPYDLNAIQVALIDINDTLNGFVIQTTMFELLYDAANCTTFFSDVFTNETYTNAINDIGVVAVGLIEELDMTIDTLTNDLTSVFNDIVVYLAKGDGTGIPLWTSFILATTGLNIRTIPTSFYLSAPSHDTRVNISDAFYSGDTDEILGITRQHYEGISPLYVSFSSRNDSLTNFYLDMSTQIVGNLEMPYNFALQEARANDNSLECRDIDFGFQEDLDFLKDFWHTHLAPRRCSEDWQCKKFARDPENYECLFVDSVSVLWRNGDPDYIDQVVGDEGGCDCFSVYSKGYWDDAHFCELCQNTDYGPKDMDEWRNVVEYQLKLLELYPNFVSDHGHYPVYDPNVEPFVTIESYGNFDVEGLSTFLSEYEFTTFQQENLPPLQVPMIHIDISDEAADSDAITKIYRDLGFSAISGSVVLETAKFCVIDMNDYDVEVFPFNKINDYVVVHQDIDVLVEDLKFVDVDPLVESLFELSGNWDLYLETYQKGRCRFNADNMIPYRAHVAPYKEIESFSPLLDSQALVDDMNATMYCKFPNNAITTSNAQICGGHGTLEFEHSEFDSTIDQFVTLVGTYFTPMCDSLEVTTSSGTTTFDTTHSDQDVLLQFYTDGSGEGIRVIDMSIFYIGETFHHTLVLDECRTLFPFDCDYKYGLGENLRLRCIHPTFFSTMGTELLDSNSVNVDYRSFHQWSMELFY
ncbi:MAG: hypothetical protein ACTSUE_16180 [Promethearchaeota archaeon]